MKLIVVLLLLISGSALAQDTIPIINLDKKHPTKFSQQMLYLNQGLPYSGVAVTGTKESGYERIQHYEGGHLNGACLVYYKSGQLKELSHYKYGRRDSSLTYYYENGQKKAQMHYSVGAATDTTRTWYDDGQLKSQEVYTDRQDFVDIYDLYYASGQKHYEVRPSYQIRWHENGKVEVKGKILNGLPNGKMKFKDENGKLVKTEIWENGKMTESIEKKK